MTFLVSLLILNCSHFSTHSRFSKPSSYKLNPCSVYVLGSRFCLFFSQWQINFYGAKLQTIMSVFFLLRPAVGNRNQNIALMKFLQVITLKPMTSADYPLGFNLPCSPDSTCEWSLLVENYKRVIRCIWDFILHYFKGSFVYILENPHAKDIPLKIRTCE